MLKVLIAPYTNSLGHAGRSLELSRLLSQAGTEVIVAGGGEFDFIFPDEVLPTPQVPYALLGDWLRLYLPGLPFFSDTDESVVLEPERTLRDEAFTLPAFAKAWLRILKQQAPDLVVSDARPEIYWAAKALGIPFVGLVSFVWTELFERSYGYESEVQIDRKKKLLCSGISTL